jgi:hypothetical protein
MLYVIHNIFTLRKILKMLAQKINIVRLYVLMICMAQHQRHVW